MPFHQSFSKKQGLHTKFISKINFVKESDLSCKTQFFWNSWRYSQSCRWSHECRWMSMDSYILGWICNFLFVQQWDGVLSGIYAQPSLSLLRCHRSLFFAQFFFMNSSMTNWRSSVGCFLQTMLCDMYKTVNAWAGAIGFQQNLPHELAHGNVVQCFKKVSSILQPCCKCPCTCSSWMWGKTILGTTAMVILNPTNSLPFANTIWVKLSNA